MASVAEAEVQFAQKLASNEKPLRKKALKKLRSYISARSRSQSGFSEEELLKLWKGLFYCLWMQDKPLLQEELSTQISGLVHHFHSFSAQLLYLQTFLTTVKREWTGIDRLRMDKYFQLVRFMFRQMFEVLQRSQWEPSCVRLFLELLSSALLQTGAPPVGLQLHVLDLYLRELAVVGSQELSADQNLVFIEPFCKTAAKTKDRSLFRAICSSIFSTIIDQAPFAIQELMDELEQDSDSGQASDDPEEPERESKRTQNSKTKATKHINGLKAHSEEEEEEEGEDEDEDDDGLSDTEKPFDEDVGPVLQFDYGAVADKLLELSSRHNTPSRNRQRLYKIIKVLRDLSQGSFPQDEYPEEVSTDEDDDDFGSRKRIKRKHTEEEEEEEPEVKKAKGKKKKKPLPPTSEQNGDASSEEVKKKKKKKKKKKSQSPAEAADTANSESTPQLQPEVQPNVQPEPSEPSLENGHTETAPKVTKKKRKQAKKTERKVEENKLSEESQSAQTEPSLSSETPPQTQELSEGPADQTNTAAAEAAVDTAPQEVSKKKKKKKASQAEPGSELQEATNGTEPEDKETPEQNKKNGQKKALQDSQDKGGEEEKHQDCETPETIVKTPKKRKATGKKKSTSQPEPEDDSGTEKKTKKKKRKIPVEFEYEADEIQSKQLCPDSPADPPKIQKQQPAQSDFVSFQSSSPPAPLFCKARGPHTPLSTKTKGATPRSDSKKVRFGLKNNQMAEFRKSDRSLLLSPEGTSRVPFDPEQKPKCGVLKSPPTPFPKQQKKKKTKTTASPARTQKKKTGSVQARPTAADFF